MERLSRLSSADLDGIDKGSSKMISSVVIDTNIFLDCPEIIGLMSSGCGVIIPYAVLNELDAHKGDVGSVGKNARDAIRHIQCVFRDGARVEFHGGISDRGDNDILEVVKEIKASRAGRPILVTNDVVLLLKALSKGFYVAQVEFEKEEFGLGKIRWVEVDSGRIDFLYSCKNAPIPVESFTSASFVENESIIFRAGDKTALATYRQGFLAVISGQSKIHGIKAKNAEQRFLMAALMDKDIDLIICAGCAGSGKTLLSLAAGLSQKGAGQYDKILLAKAIEDVGNSIGYLKGTKDEKLGEWTKPYFDNLQLLMRKDMSRVDVMMDKEEIELEALTFMRGRSLLSTYCVFDELQNVDPRHLKMLVSRLGDGSKMVLLGDLGQIDSSKLSYDYNGLRHAMERMSGLENVAIFNLQNSVRKKLTSQAIERL